MTVDPQELPIAPEWDALPAFERAVADALTQTMRDAPIGPRTPLERGLLMASRVAKAIEAAKINGQCSDWRLRALAELRGVGSPGPGGTDR